MKVIPKSKWSSFRDWIAWKLVDFAKWISPKNENAMSFLMEKVMENELELMKFGRSEIEIKVRKTNRRRG